MANEPVTIVRIYIREGERLLNDVLEVLRDNQRVAGLTVLRGITGFGKGGTIHPASLVDLSLDLPLVVEFYDHPERVESALKQLSERITLPHVVSWPAVAHMGGRS